MLMRGRTSARRRALLLGALFAVLAGLMVPAFAVDPGGVHFDGAYATDGYINLAESGAADPGGRPVTWTAPGLGEDYAEARFADAADVTFPGGTCGPFTPLAVTGTGTDGYLNSSCMAAIADDQLTPGGAVTAKVEMVWMDDAGTPGVPGDDTVVLEDEDTILVDTLVGSPSVSIDDSAVSVGKVSTPEASLGVPIAWDFDDDDGEPGSISLTVRNDPGSVPAACDYTPQIDGPVVGSVTPACWAALADGDVIAEASGADVAGNPMDASSTTVLDRVGSGPATGLTMSPSCVNSTTPSVTVSGSAPASTPAVTSAGGTLTSSGGGSMGSSAPVAGGTFSISFVNPAASLADGSLSASVVLVDADGNPSPSAGVGGSTLDTSIPNPPVITAPAQGALVGGGQSQTYLVAGTSEANAGVEVWETTPLGVPTTLLFSTTANAAGAWQGRSPRTTTGTKFIRARQTDACGNGPSNFSLVRSFEFDTDLPTSEITGPPNLATILPGDPLIVTGNASDADSGVLAVEVHVYDITEVEIRNFDPLHPSVNPNQPPEVIVGHGEVTQGNATCASCGALPPTSRNVTWSMNLSLLGRGVYQIEVFAIDRAGNRQIQPSVTRVIKAG